MPHLQQYLFMLALESFLLLPQRAYLGLDRCYVHLYRPAVLAEKFSPVSDPGRTLHTR